MNRNFLLLTGLVTLAAVGVGGYFAYEYFFRAKTTGTPKVEVGPTIERQAVPVPEVRFTDVTGAVGIRFRHSNGAAGRKLLPETMGSGVAVIDYDRDGRPDLFFPNGRA